MIKTLKKLLICICIMMVLFNFTMEIPSNAITSEEALADSFKGLWQNANGDTTVTSIISGALEGLAGLIFMAIRWCLMAVLVAIQGLGAGVAVMAGTKTGEDVGVLTPDDVIFNKVYLTDINFFEVTGLPEKADVVVSIREQIALWYYIMRTIAIVILLGILIFVGIKMAITTVASDKAIYKKALFDWFTSLALVFLLHYIIRGVIWINNGLVDVMRNIGLNSGGIGGSWDTTLGALRLMAVNFSFFEDISMGMAAFILYGFITVQSFMFLISYIKRMIVIAFLIIISPLITITYSIDKMGDQKAQALNTWLKEFSYNILIQPFHCILYLVFLEIAVRTVASTGSMAAMVLGVLCIKFIWDGEKIVRKIFGFESASSLVSLAASSAIVGGAINKAVNAGKATATGVKYAKNTKTGQLIKQKWSDKKENRLKDKAAKEATGIKGMKYEHLTDKQKQAADERIKNKKENKTPIRKMKEAAEYRKLKKNGETGSKAELKNKAAQNVADKARRKANKPDGKIKGWMKNNEFAKALGSDAKRFTRSLLQPEKLAKVSAGILAGTLLYALPDSNIVTAVAGGYGAGKTLENKVREMRNRKNENYEEDVLKAWESHCNANPRIDRNDKSAFEKWMQQNEAEGKLKMYSGKNVDKKEDKAREDLTEQKEKFGLSENDIEAILASIRLTLAKGEVYNPSELFKDYTSASVSAEDINKIVGGFAAIYNNSIIYEKTDAFDTQMEQFGYDHEDVMNDMDVSKLQVDPARQFERFAGDDIREIINNDPTLDETAIMNQLDKKVEDRLNDTQSELETIIANLAIPAGMSGDINSIVSRLETDLQSAIDNGVRDLEKTIERTLDGFGVDVKNIPTKTITEIKEKIEIQRDTQIEREIINNISTPQSRLVIDEIKARKK